MAYKKLYCPTCERETKHKVTGGPNVLVTLILLCLGVFPGLIYLVFCAARGKPAPVCTVAHAAVRRARAEEEAEIFARAIREAGGAGHAPPVAPVATPAAPVAIVATPAEALGRRAGAWLRRVA